MKQNIAPMKAYQVDLIGKRVALFELRCKLYREDFKIGNVISYYSFNRSQFK